MPIYFIDVYDGERSIRDEHGFELDSVEQAAEEVAALLPHLARDATPDRESRDFAALVRDGDETVVYRAALLYRGQRMAAQDGQVGPCLSESQDLILRSRETRAAAERVSARLRADVAELLAVIEAVSRSSAQIAAGRGARS